MVRPQTYACRSSHALIRHPANPLANPAVQHRRRHFDGLFFDEFESASAWIRETGRLRLPPLSTRHVVIHAEYCPHPDAHGLEAGAPGIDVRVDGRPAAAARPAAPGPFTLEFNLPTADSAHRYTISLHLRGVVLTNLLAWLGRVTGFGPSQRFRTQNRNRQLRIHRVEADGEILFDFSNRHSPYSTAFARRQLKLGLNIAGYLTADLGIGESARCMVRAADAANLPSALIDLKLPVKNRRGDQAYASRLQTENPHEVNVIHLDPPGARDIDHHHGAAFRAGKYNIGYWAWELPEFPDAWTPYFDYYDEIWCPSDFVREAVAMKSPVPVITMPHAIAFPRPEEPVADLRARFGLPADRFLFLFIYDLNSYSARKNPQATIEAFRTSGLAGRGAALVIKTHSAKGNEEEIAALRADVADLPGTVLITDTLDRADLYRLEAACDCFVSLHRSEGFGLAIAECMYLGKPVIATDWSATAEYLDAHNGCPVRARAVTLDRNVGPYAKGQTWAEPDIHHAGEWMQRLFDDTGLRDRLGAAARATMEERFSPDVIGGRYRRRLEAIAIR